jgi:hypothetical protein
VALNYGFSQSGPGDNAVTRLAEGGADGDYSEEEGRSDAEAGVA